MGWAFVVAEPSFEHSSPVAVEGSDGESDATCFENDHDGSGAFCCCDDSCSYSSGFGASSVG